jgi:hypothetical protein
VSKISLSTYLMPTLFLYLWLSGQDHSSAQELVTDGSELSTVLQKKGYIPVSLKRLQSGSLCVPARVGKANLLLVVDTGAPDSHFDVERTRELGLVWHTVENKAAAGGTSKVAYIDGIEIGSLKTKRRMVSSHDVTFVNRLTKEHFGDPPVDGFIGGDFLKEYAAVIDFANACLFVRAKEAPGNDK